MCFAKFVFLFISSYYLFVYLYKSITVYVKFLLCSSICRRWASFKAVQLTFKKQGRIQTNQRRSYQLVFLRSYSV